MAGSDKGGVAQKSNELPSQNPEATAVNLRNSLVVHAGPGKPYIGGVYAPAAPNEKGKKK
ncbi:MAG: hypothetical protein HY057_11935 [Rhodospirillales bacterium]|nr:hypothetical protein [Rhodospirillales bacterium]